MVEGAWDWVLGQEEKAGRGAGSGRGTLGMAWDGLGRLNGRGVLGQARSESESKNVINPGETRIKNNRSSNISQIQTLKNTPKYFY